MILKKSKKFPNFNNGFKNFQKIFSKFQQWFENFQNLGEGGHPHRLIYIFQFFLTGIKKFENNHDKLLDVNRN